MNEHPWVKAERDFYEDKYDELVNGLDLSSVKTVLDLGSGTGGFASRLAEAYPNLQVLAIDSNPEAVNLAKEHYRHVPNLRFEVGSSIPEGQYDLIFKNLFLHEAAEDEYGIKQLLKDSHDSLNEGGLVSILETRKVPKEEYHKLYEQKKHPQREFEEDHAVHNKYSTDDWIKMCEEVGYTTTNSKELAPNYIRYVGQKGLNKNKK